MTSIKALLWRTFSLALLACLCGPLAAQDQPELNLELAIQQLSSRRFEIRQQAFDRLVSEGSRAITAVESSADQRDPELGRRCVEILAAIAREKETRDEALESLDRLGSNAGFLGSSLAKKRSFQLRETQQERAIRLLTAVGVRVHRSSRSDKVHYVSGIYRDRDCVHLQHLPSAKQVSLSGLGITDKCFAYLAKVPQLEGVTMIGCSVSDAGLAELPKLAKLKNIGLSGDSFSARGLKYLGEIPNLFSIAIFSPIGSDELQVLSSISVRSLYLGEVSMSEQVANILANLEGLGSLSLTLKGVANDDLRWVKQSQLRSIGLTIADSPEMTDEGLRHLQIPALRSLQLRRTGITDQGLVTVGRIKALSTLSVYDSPITDEGLQQLSGLDQLRSLSLRGTKVTDAALESLRQLMPNLRYVRNSQGARIPAPIQAPAPPIKIVPENKPN